MPSRPLVSVIVPTYNYGRFIGETLECLRAQTYPYWECVVVDDGSTDDTAGRVARFTERDPRFKFFRQSNRLQGAAKNTGLRHTAGQYVQFLDADDLIEPRKFERQVEYLERHPEVDIVYGDVRFFPTENPAELLYTMWGENRPWQPGVAGRGREVLLPLLRLNSIPINTPLTRRGLVERVGPFDEELPPVEDWDFWLRCAEEGARFHFSDMEGTRALVRSHPASSSKSRLRLVSSILLMRKRLAGRLGDAEARRVNAELLAEAEGTLGAEEVLRGSRARGARRLAKAALLDRNPRHRLKWLACALAAPLVGRSSFEKLYSSSITHALKGLLGRPQAGARR